MPPRRRERGIALDRLERALREPLVAIGARSARRSCERREETEVDVHRREAVGVGRREELQQRAVRGRGIGPRRHLPALRERHLDAGEPAERRRLHVALDARDLARDVHARALVELERRAEMARRVQVGVAVDGAIAREHRLLRARQRAEDPLLLAHAQLGLESHQAVERALFVLLPQLHHGVGAPARARIDEADRLHRAVRERVAPAPRHLLHGKTALEVERGFERVQRNGVGREQRLHERLVARAVERQIQIVAGSVVVARGAKRHLHVDRVRVHDRRERIVEIQVLLAEHALEILREATRGERARGEHDRALVGNAIDARLAHGHARVRRERLGDPARERIAIHREGLARGHRRFVGRRDHERVEAPHLLLEQPHRARLAVRAQRVAAHELREEVGAVRGRALCRLHVDERDVEAAARCLPGGLAAREPRPDDDYLQSATPG